MIKPFLKDNMAEDKIKLKPEELRVEKLGEVHLEK